MKFIIFSQERDSNLLQSNTDNITVLVFKFYGHIKRHDGLEKDIVEKAVPGKRSKGSPVIVLPQYNHQDRGPCLHHTHAFRMAGYCKVLPYYGYIKIFLSLSGINNALILMQT